jgi:transposase InsO family protein
MYTKGESDVWAQCFCFSALDCKAWSRHLHDEINQNLTLAQRELMLWHQKLSHAGLTSIHNLCRQRRTPKVTTEEDLIPLLAGIKMPSDVCNNLLCGSCAAAKAHRKQPGIHPANSGKKHSSLRPSDIRPGDCISCDHYGSPVKGRVVSSSGHSSTQLGYECGCIFVDNASGYMLHQPQRSMAAGDTIRSKLVLEREAADVGVKIKAIHTDNGVFNSAEFRAHCKSMKQNLGFSAVGAHHQNGIAENAIRTICMA